MTAQPKSIGENLRKLLELQADLSLSDLARKTKIPQPTLHHIVEGKTKKPRKEALEALARFFSISVAQLVGVVPFSPTIPDVIKEDLKISTIPLINWEQARNWERDKNDLSVFDKIFLEGSVDKNTFALQLNDSSLEPLFQEKTILVFDPSRAAKERDFIIAYLAKPKKMVFNRLFIDGKNYYIKQDTSDGNATLIKLNLPEDEIVATLIQSRLHF